MIVIGIDIGVTGAIAGVDSRGSCSIDDLPTLAVKGERMVRKRIDPRRLRDQVRALVPPGEPAIAIIEDVHTLPSRYNAPQTQGSLMHSRGVIETVLELAGVTVHAVQPGTWKRLYGLIGGEKSDSLARARALYPNVQHLLERQKDHNRAESVLLAHYGLRTLA